MLGFITGLLLGGTLGTAVMALCNAAKSADEEMETKIKYGKVVLPVTEAIL